MKTVLTEVYQCEKCTFKTIHLGEMKKHENECEKLMRKTEKQKLRKEIYSSLYIKEINLLINEYVKKYIPSIEESTEHLKVIMKNWGIIVELSHFKLRGELDINQFKFVQNLREFHNDYANRGMLEYHLRGFEDYTMIKEQIQNINSKISMLQKELQIKEEELSKIYVNTLILNIEGKK